MGSRIRLDTVLILAGLTGNMLQCLTIWVSYAFSERSVPCEYLLWKKAILLAALALLASLVIACGGDSATDEEKDMQEGAQAPFRIGVMESLTGPGETYGSVALQAKQMAVDEINAAGGINGRMLELIVEDSKCSAQDAITAYNKLTDVDGVKIILGTSCSRRHAGRGAPG